MNLYDYILEIISKKELKITREEVDDAIRLYMKAYNSNPKYKEDFIYKRITDYYTVGELFKENLEEVSDDVNIIVPETLEWGEYFNRVGEYKIINGKQFVQGITKHYKNKFYHNRESQLLLYEDKEKCHISMLRISPDVIRDVKKNKCIIIGKFILVYDDKGTIQIYRKPYSAEKGYREKISKYILNLKFIDCFYDDNKNIEWEKLILKKITDNVEKNFLRVVYFMIGEKYGIKNKKEAGLEYIFKKNSRNEIKNIPKVFLENKKYKDIFHKGIIVLLISEWHYWDITMMTRLHETPHDKLVKKFNKINALYEECIKFGDSYNTALDNLKILADINSNLQKIVEFWEERGIAPGFEKIKEYAEKIKLELEEKYLEQQVRSDLLIQGHDLDNESENDFNESDE